MLEIFHEVVLYGLGAVALLVLLVILSGPILRTIGLIIEVIQCIAGLVLVIALYIPAQNAGKEMLRRLPKHQWLTEKEVWGHGFSPIITTEALGILRWRGKVMTKEVDTPDGDIEPTKEKIYMIPNEVLTDKNGPYIRV